MIHADAESLALIKKILRVFVPEGRKVVAFGSRVTGVRLKQHSDLDICVMGDTPMTWREMSDLNDAFVNSNVPFRVDIVDWNSTSPEFQEIIIQQSELVEL